MTEELFREDSYLRECDAVVVAVVDDALILDRTILYPLGGGQPGDTGTLSFAAVSVAIIDTRYGDDSSIRHILLELVAADHAVSCRWISEAELDAQPELVRTMSVQPPRGKGSIRLLEIDSVDLQPCGGTHLHSTAEVGAVRIGKVEKKGKRNRRVNIHLDD